MYPWLPPVLLTLVGLIVAEVLYRYWLRKRFPELFDGAKTLWIVRAICQIPGCWICLALTHRIINDLPTFVALAWDLPIIVIFFSGMFGIYAWRPPPEQRQPQQPPPTPPTGGMING
jgi:hypothetical protein